MSVDRLSLFFIACYFAQGMVGMAYEPISYLLKDGLGLGAAQTAAFVSVMTLPFLLKPILGLFTDALPLAGRRRRPYLILSAFATSAAWAALALMPRYEYGMTLFLLTLVNVGICFTDVLCDGVMVERGRATGLTGAYQALQIGTLYLTLLATGAGGGWLAAHAGYREIFALTAVFPLFILVSAWSLPEAASAAPIAQAKRAGAGLKSLLMQKPFWAACGVILLYNFTPFRGTSMFFHQNDALGFGKVFVGWLGTVDGACGALGAWAFWKLRKGGFRLAPRFDTMTLLRWSVLAGAPLTLAYAAYSGPVSAIALTALFGVGGVAARLVLMELAAKTVPEHGEAAGFAIFMSVFNLAAWSSNNAGAKLYEIWGPAAGPQAALALLALIGAAAAAACWPLLPHLRPEGSAA